MNHIVDTCEELFECMKGVKSVDDIKVDAKTRRAVVMCLLDLGELIEGLNESERAEYPSEHWKDIVCFSNRALHEYRLLDFDMAFNIAADRVPPLYKFLKQKQETTNEEED